MDSDAVVSKLISFVLPAYNEVESLPYLLDEILGVVDDHSWNVEILIVDDGSTDGTDAAIRSVSERDSRVRAIRLRGNRGKSPAIQVGLESIEGDVVVLMDADGQDDPSELPKLFAAMDLGADLVTGQRAVRHDRLVKRSTSRVYNWATHRLTGIEGRDFNSGFKVMRAEVAGTLELYGELHRYIPVLAAWNGFTVTEVPVNHRSRIGGHSKFGRTRFWRGYLDLVTVKFLTTYTNRPLHLFGSIGSIFGLAGFAILFYLFIEKLGGHAIGTRPALTAGVLMVIVGVQLVSLGLVAELIVNLANRRRPSRGIPPW